VHLGRLSGTTRIVKYFGTMPLKFKKGAADIVEIYV
jgi:hypothetical protein